MNMNRSIEDKFLKMIHFILARKKTNYSEIADYFGLSKRTVSKYLNRIADIVEPAEVELIRKQNTGVYFSGEVRGLKQYLEKIRVTLSDSNEERIMYIYSKLIFSSEPVKIQEMADELYVSRGTLEKALKEVRQLFTSEGILIESNKYGLSVKSSEKEKRSLISKLINFYWGGIKYTEKQDKKLMLQIQFSNTVEDIINMEILEKVINVLHSFTQISRLNLTDYEYQSLTIHLTIALERIKQEQYLERDLATVKLEENTKVLISLLEDTFSLELPEYEKEYINIHIVAIQKSALNGSKSEEVDVSGVNDTLRMLLMSSLKNMQPDKELLSSLTIHLSAAIKRLQLGLSIYNPYTEKIKKSFPRAFEEAVGIKKQLESTYPIVMNDDEIAFITLHIESFYERSKEEKVKKKVIVVCSSGMGTSRLLEQRLKKMFADEMIITRVLSIGELVNADLTENLIISTVPIENSQLPVILISPLLNKEDIQNIRHERFLKGGSGKSSAAFISLLEKELIFIDRKKTTKKSVIEWICQSLISKEYAVQGILESALRREELSSTALGKFAMPHSEIEFVKHSKIVIYVNQDGIEWDKEKVRIVFFFAINEQAKNRITEIYDFFNELISDDRQLSALIKASDAEEVVNLLQGGEK